MKKQAARTLAMIFNFITALLCALSIAAYVALPFWEVQASYFVDEQTLETSLKKFVAGENTEGDATIDYDKLVEDAVGEDGLTIKLALTFEAKTVVSFLLNDPKTCVNEIIDANVSNILSDLSVELEKISKGLVTATSKQTLDHLLTEQVQSAFAEEKSQEEIDEILTKSDITPDYKNEKVNALVKAIYNDEASVESVANEAVTIVEDFVNKLASSGEPELADLQLTDSAKQEIKDTVTDALKNFSDENGNIIIEDLISKGMAALLQAQNTPQTPPTDNGGGDNPEGNPECMSIRLTSEPIPDGGNADGGTDDTQNVQQTQEDLETALREKIKELIPESAINGIATGMKFAAYLLLFSIGVWAYIVLKILVKAATLNNTVKLITAIWLGAIPFVIFYAIPTLAVTFIQNPPSILNASITEPLKAFHNLSANFYSSGWVAFICSLVLFVLSFFLMRIRKNLRTIQHNEALEAKKAKKEAKAAKKAAKKQAKNPTKKVGTEEKPKIEAAKTEEKQEDKKESTDAKEESKN